MICPNEAVGEVLELKMAQSQLETAETIDCFSAMAHPDNHIRRLTSSGSLCDGLVGFREVIIMSMIYVCPTPSTVSDHGHKDALSRGKTKALSMQEARLAQRHTRPSRKSAVGSGRFCRMHTARNQAGLSHSTWDTTATSGEVFCPSGKLGLVAGHGLAT